MSKEIGFPSSTGATCYAVITNAVGQAWNTSTAAFEALGSADWSSYAIACAEAATATGIYFGNFPTAINTAGRYAILAYKQSGGSPAVSDTVAASGAMDWTGSAPAYLGADTSGTTTLLARIGEALSIASGKVAATMGATDYAGNTVQTSDVAGVGATLLTAINEVPAAVWAISVRTLSSAGLDAVMVTTSYNARRALNLILGLVGGGKLSGVPTAGSPGTVVIRDPDDSRYEATIAVDGNGNRTGVTLNPPA